MRTDDQAGLATGALLLVLGVWLVLRTFVHDAQGQNLVDRLVKLAGGSSSSSSQDANPDSPLVNANPLSFLHPPSASGTQRPNRTWQDMLPNMTPGNRGVGAAQTNAPAALRNAWLGWRHSAHSNISYAAWVRAGEPGYGRPQDIVPQTIGVGLGFATGAQ